MFNLKYHCVSKIVPKNENELAVVALVDIQEDFEPFQLSNNENPKHVCISESELNDVNPVVGDHVKKFVASHHMFNNEKYYFIPEFYLFGGYIVFYVNTTNDESLSNCKYTPGECVTTRLIKVGEELNDSNMKFTPAFMTIKTTRLIKKGEELMLYCEMIDNE